MSIGWLLLPLGVLDALVRPWTPLRERARHTAFYLFIAYGVIGAAALGVPRAVLVIVMAVAGLLALYNFARMVGLTQHPLFFASAAAATLAFYVAATVHFYALFQAMPVYAVSLAAATGTLVGDSRAFLQKLCLSWLGLLVFGYLLAHAVLFVDDDFRATLPGAAWLAVSLGLAKAADVASLAWMRAWGTAGGGHLVASPIGGAAAALAVHAVAPGIMSPAKLGVLGALVGAGLAVGGRAYTHIVNDVLGEAEERPRKGAMVFAVAFAIALAYHFVRYVS